MGESIWTQKILEEKKKLKNLKFLDYLLPLGFKLPRIFNFPVISWLLNFSLETLRETFVAEVLEVSPYSGGSHNHPYSWALQNIAF